MLENGWEYEIRKNKLYIISKIRNRKAFKSIRKYFKPSFFERRPCKYAEVKDGEILDKILRVFRMYPNETNARIKEVKQALEKEEFCRGCILCPEGEKSLKCSLLKSFHANGGSFSKCSHPYFVEQRCKHSKYDPAKDIIYCKLFKKECKATKVIEVTGEKIIRFGICDRQEIGEVKIPSVLIGVNSPLNGVRKGGN
jgi:hypothetical protein